MFDKYQELIREDAENMGFRGIDPRHIEAYMVKDCQPIAELTGDEFKLEVVFAAKSVIEDGETKAEMLAKSYGL